ncbi:MAG: endonuclease/exonuclease/phosphatase family protein [Pikeienuella sp.]
MRGDKMLKALVIAALAAVLPMTASALDLAKPPGTVRAAQFNAALVRQGAGVLLADIEARDPQVLAVAEIILRTRPDILLINELDADPEGRALSAFLALLAGGVAGFDGIAYPHSHQGPQNVGVFSGLDLDQDGTPAGPGDAWGFGRFPGQYAMALLSRWPLGEVRSFTRLRWSAMPAARRPRRPDGAPFHPDSIWQALRLSSKAHWIAPVQLPGGTLYIVAAHPTPPVFDGPEHRNGRRNADEIRLIREILDTPEGRPGWLIDDAGGLGGLPPEAAFLVAGDLNADPQDGDGIRSAIAALLAHPRIQDPKPRSAGGAEGPARRGPGERPRKGDPALHTAEWRRRDGSALRLRVDYVLPSAGLELRGAGVFWPTRGTAEARLTGQRGGRLISSDHRLIWVDLAAP